MNNVFTLEKLFADRVFHVPDYQRGYAWEEQQLSEFIEDIEWLTAGKDHYTGTIVLFDQEEEQAGCVDEEGKHYGVSGVVDGQQRLTTVVLLLDAIRREMAKTESLGKLADGIRKTYIELKDQADQPMQKLVLNRDCREYFARNVLSDQPGPEGPSIQSHRRLTAAQQFFARYLAEKRKTLQTGYEDWLKGLRSKVVQHLKVTLYTVEDQAEVGVIFEVLNNRGKPLSELEKVKNYLLFLASKLDVPKHHLAEEVNRAWTLIFERLMQANLTSGDDEDQLLRSHWLMAHDHLRKNWAGSKSIKGRFNLRRPEYVGKHIALLSDLTEYTQSLEKASLAFCEAHRPGCTEAFGAWKSNLTQRKQVIAWSEKLCRIRVLAPFLPLLMATRLRFPTDGARYLELVRFCEVFAFRVYRFHGARSHTGQSSLFRYANLLYAGSVNLDKVLADVRGLLLYYSPTQRFHDECKNPDDWYHWYGIKYFLYEYEEELAKGEAIRLSWEDLEKRDLEKSVEHILPQTPTDSYWTDRFNEADVRRWMHDIGNLCLTSHNGSYGNKPFPDKKGKPGDIIPCYANSNLFIERALWHIPDWNPKAVEARQQEIVDWAIKRWHVEDVASVRPEAQDELADSEE